METPEMVEKTGPRELKSWYVIFGGGRISVEIGEMFWRIWIFGLYLDIFRLIDPGLMLWLRFSGTYIEIYARSPTE